MKKSIKWAVALLTAAFLLMLALSSLSAAVLSAALSADTYSTCFDAYADTSLSGVEKDAYPALAEALSGYFNGKLDTPQIEVEKSGAPAAAYSDKELTHLADVKALLDGLGVFRRCALGLCVLFALALYLLFRRGRRFPTEAERSAWEALNVWPGALVGAAAALLVAAAAAVWGLVNFDGLFITLHKLLFRNNLWLLNPNTDLLIQLMPEKMFVHLGAAVVRKALVTPLIVFVLIVIGAAALLRAEKKKPTPSGDRT